jgi:hypothetical protein
VVRVVRVRAVLFAVLVAVLGAVFVELLAPADGHAGLVAVDVAVARAVLMAVHVAMGVAVLTLMLVAMVSRFLVVVLVNVSGHVSSLDVVPGSVVVSGEIVHRTGVSVNKVL